MDKEPFCVIFEWAQRRSPGDIAPFDVTFDFATRNEALQCAAWCAKVAAEGGGDGGWINAKVTIYGLECEEYLRSRNP